MSAATTLGSRDRAVTFGARAKNSQASTTVAPAGKLTANPGTPSDRSHLSLLPVCRPSLAF